MHCIELFLWDVMLSSTSSTECFSCTLTSTDSHSFIFSLCVYARTCMCVHVCSRACVRVHTEARCHFNHFSTLFSELPHLAERGTNSPSLVASKPRGFFFLPPQSWSQGHASLCPAPARMLEIDLRSSDVWDNPFSEWNISPGPF